MKIPLRINCFRRYAIRWPGPRPGCFYREIGTRKALGAPNSAIRLQFIMESMIICMIGSIIGILLRVTAGIAAAKMLGSVARPSGESILLSLGFSMAIGIFFGYYPANKAAKMDLIAASASTVIQILLCVLYFLLLQKRQEHERE